MIVLFSFVFGTIVIVSTIWGITLYNKKKSEIKEKQIELDTVINKHQNLNLNEKNMNPAPLAMPKSQSLSRLNSIAPAPANINLGGGNGEKGDHESDDNDIEALFEKNVDTNDGDDQKNAMHMKRGDNGKTNEKNTVVDENTVTENTPESSMVGLCQRK